MACGAGALIIILSTFNGFENLAAGLQESFQPDITVTPIKNKQFQISSEQWKALNAHPNVKMVSMIYEDKVYVKYGNKDLLASMKGVDRSYFQTNEVKDYIVAGDTVLENDEYSFAMIGMGLAQKLGINLNNQFEQMEVFSPKSEAGGTSMLDNFERSFITPGAVFSIYQEYDDKYILVPIAFMQYLKSVDENQITALEIKLKNSSEKSIKQDVEQILGRGFKVRDKLELNETFYKISRIEKMITFFILVFVLLILSFNFIGSLTMHILEKKEDIQMLYYLGLKSKDIFRLYMVYGILQGVLGGLAGLGIGLIVCAIQYYFGVIELPGSGTFVIQAYPVMIYGEDVLYISLILVIVSALASIFPAWRAKQILYGF